jgi:hypothetical protein
MSDSSVPIHDVLGELAEGFATAVPAVDAKAEHDRWKPGIGPFEEQRQVAMLLDEFHDTSNPNWAVDTEVEYPDTGERCDIVVTTDGRRFPIEAKLLRFRLDNGNIDSNCYMSVFSPFPEAGSSSMLTDVKKLADSGFDVPGGMLGLYYEKEDEPYGEMDVERIARKFVLDVDYWYDIDVELNRIARFSGLRHPHHQRGAVVAWNIVG